MKFENFNKASKKASPTKLIKLLAALSPSTAAASRTQRLMNSSGMKWLSDVVMLWCRPPSRTRWRNVCLELWVYERQGWRNNGLQTLFSTFLKIKFIEIVYLWVCVALLWTMLVSVSVSYWGSTVLLLRNFKWLVQFFFAKNNIFSLENYFLRKLSLVKRALRFSSDIKILGEIEPPSTLSSFTFLQYCPFGCNIMFLRLKFVNVKSKKANDFIINLTSKHKPCCWRYLYYSKKRRQNHAWVCSVQHRTAPKKKSLKTHISPVCMRPSRKAIS